MEENKQLTAIQKAKKEFGIILHNSTGSEIISNTEGAFEAAEMIVKLESVLTDEIMTKVFMPLQNKKIGFLTDNQNGYTIKAVREAVIDAAALGLLPTGNQFNILSGRMYPTKEGYTALLKKLSATMGLHYVFEFDAETIAKSASPDVVAIPCIIKYKSNAQPDGNNFRYIASVQKRNGATWDNLRGKAERKTKKAFYEFLTGNDFGDGDSDTPTIDTNAEVIETKTNDDKMGAVADRILASKGAQTSILDEKGGAE